MSSKNSKFRVCKAPAFDSSSYLGHFTSPGVGERPFLSFLTGVEFRNTHLVQSQHPPLHAFTRIDAKSLTASRYGDFRAQIRAELL